MGEWRALGGNSNGRHVDGASANDWRVFNYPTDTGAYPTLASDGFSVQDCKDVDLLFVVGSFSGKVRLAWYDFNSGQWFEETTTITLPHPDANSRNVNHEVQRSPRGKHRCAIIVEPDSNTSQLQAWVNGRDDTV